MDYDALTTRGQPLTPCEYRTLNRYYLHPLGKRFCNTCLHVFTGIPHNFNIKRYHRSENGSTTVSYESKCKPCRNSYNLDWRLELRQDHGRFIRNTTKSIRSRAKTQGLTFNLDSDYLITQFEEQERRCYYTGQFLDFTLVTSKRNSPHRDFPSLDRREPSLGYVKGNVVWCRYAVNRMKNDLTEKEFLGFARDITERFE